MPMPDHSISEAEAEATRRFSSSTVAFPRATAVLLTVLRRKLDSKALEGKGA